MQSEENEVIAHGHRLLHQIYSRTSPQLLHLADKTMQLKYGSSTFSILDTHSLAARTKILEIQKKLQSEDENQKPVPSYFTKALQQLRPKEQDSILYNELQMDVLAFYANHKNLMQFYTTIEQSCKQPFKEYYDYIRATLGHAETADLALDSLYYRYLTCIVFKSGLEQSRYRLMSSFGKCLHANKLDPIFCKPQIDKLKDMLELQITNVAHLEKETIEKVSKCKTECSDAMQKLNFLNQFHDHPALVKEDYQQQIFKEVNKTSEAITTLESTLQPVDVSLIIQKKRDEMEQRAQHCVASIFCPNIYNMESNTKENDIKSCYESALPILRNIIIIDLPHS